MPVNWSCPRQRADSYTPLGAVIRYDFLSTKRKAMGHPIGLAALTVLELTPPEMVSCAVDAGFDCVGLRLIPATPQEVQHPMVGDTQLVRETERRLKDTGLRVLDVEIFRLRPETVVGDYEAALATGARFGATRALSAGNDPDEARLIVDFGGFCDIP